MKKIKISRIIIATALIGTLATAGAHSVRAATNNTRTDPRNNLVTLLAQKFNLSEAEIQKVFEEQRTQMESERTKAHATRLDQAVTEGKLTRAQADLILAKKAAMTSTVRKTAVERLEARKVEMDALKTWAKTNNIPMEYLRFGGPKGPGGGHEKKFNRSVSGK